jgi:hypothetical protein
MTKYPSIKNVWKRDPDNNYKTLIEGGWASEAFRYLRMAEWCATEKVDGMNIRVIYDPLADPNFLPDGAVSIGGRTDKAQLPGDLLGTLVDMFPANRLHWTLEGDCVTTLYGEGYGPGIQKVGGLYREDKSFILFDVKVGSVWLERDNVEAVAKALEIESVPTILYGSLHGLIQAVRSGRTSEIGGEGCPMEGLVCRPKVELQDRFGQRIITKIKTKDFAE